ncbi:MAG: response regulator transcription factor [Bacteroidota bacterium]|nr:response regulator transcription factor [Bacteroidota bacterium]
MESNGKKILIADDEPDIVEIIQFNLQQNGYDVYSAADGDEALEKARLLMPQMIILDIMMPYKTGIEVCRKLRQDEKFDDTLIVFLTAINDDISHIKGLDIGADDYINKPVSTKVLVSRVNALFRRMAKPADNDGKILNVSGITIDPQRYIVSVKNDEITLAKKEFELLYLLASKPGKVFLRNEILTSVWGTDVIVGDRTIDVHIRKIRQKLEIDCVTTVKGVGYKFEC